MFVLQVLVSGVYWIMSAPDVINIIRSTVRPRKPTLNLPLPDTPCPKPANKALPELKAQKALEYSSLGSNTAHLDTRSLLIVAPRSLSLL